METKEIIIIAVTAGLVVGIFLSLIFSFLIVRSRRQNRQQAQEQRKILRVVLEIQETERKLLGEDLQEELGPMLAALRWKTSNLPGMPDPSDSQVIKSFNDMIDQIKGKVKELSNGLIPPAIKEQGLLTVLQQFLISTGAQTNIHIHFQHSIKEIHLETAVARQVFRIIIELCQLIIRYAEATILEIKIRKDGNAYVFSLSDNGKPFDLLDCDSSSDSMLKNIAARVWFIRGSFHIQKQQRGGNHTEIKVLENPNPESL